MIQEITRTLSGTYIAANNSVLFNSAPYLSANNELTLFFPQNDVKIAAEVFSVANNAAVISFKDSQYDNAAVVVKTPNFGAGLTGAQEPFSLTTSTTPSTLLQAISTGGTSTINVEVSTSLNGGWVNIGSLVPTVANGNTHFISITQPWGYARLNISSIGASNSVRVNKAN